MNADLQDAIKNAAEILSEDDRPQKLKELIDDISSRFPGTHKLEIFHGITEWIDEF